MNKQLIAALVTLSVIICGCNPVPEPTLKKTTAPEDGMPKRDPMQSRLALSKDRGDVEQTLHVEVVLAPESALPNIGVRKTEDSRPRLNLLELNVNPPYPSDLNLIVQGRTSNDFSTSPVVIRMKLYLDDVEVGSLNGVVGKAPFDTIFAQQTVDVWKDKTDLPKSMLVIARGEALLMPEGTDIATIDPATATTTPERIAQLMSNPVRINIRGDDDTASDETAPSEATDSSVDVPPAEPAPAVDAVESPAPAPAQ